MEIEKDAKLVSFMISDSYAQGKEVDATVGHGIGHGLRKGAHRCAGGAHVIYYNQSLAPQGVGINYAECACKIRLTLEKRHGGLGLVGSARLQRQAELQTCSVSYPAGYEISLIVASARAFQPVHRYARHEVGAIEKAGHQQFAPHNLAKTPPDIGKVTVFHIMDGIGKF